jgi:rod shape-determining protein MreD
MLLNYVKPFFFFIPLAVLQLVVVPLIAIDSITPNLVFLLVVYYTIREGQIFGTILGFITGFLFDLFSSGLLGSSMFAFTISAFIAGYFYSENKMDINLNTYFFLVIVFLSAIVSSFIYSAINASGSGIGFLFLLVEGALLPSFYTTLFGVPIVVFSSKKEIL